MYKAQGVNFAMTLDRQALAALLRQMAGTRLLVVGDFMLDRTIFGVASRISPEAPTPVVLVQQSRDQLGGAGNVVRNVDSLGGQIWSVAVVGDDAGGRVLEERLRVVRGCKDIRILREPGRKTTLKTRVVALQGGRATAGASLYGHQQMLRLDEETRTPITAETAAQVLEFAAGALHLVQGMIISDYAKGALPPSLLQQLIEQARAAAKPVFVDPKASAFDRYRGASVLTPNASETEASLGVSISGAGDAPGPGWEKTIQDRLAEWSLDALLVTRGAEGLSLIDRSGFHHFPTSAREVFDVTGAGDTVLAAFSLAAASGASYADAAQFGNLAAGVAVRKAGTAAVYPYEIEREFDVRHVSTDAKIRTAPEMRAIADTLRRENKKIVFTNGCFDLLHVGHMYLLREARKLGDVLVVGLNSDASVRAIKGESRPIVPQQDRAEAIAALESVDYLVVFEEPDPMALLQAIRPDVLVKGDDYRTSEVVGADFLNSYGGQVRLIPVRQGVSTSRLVETIRSGQAPSTEQ